MGDGDRSASDEDGDSQPEPVKESVDESDHEDIGDDDHEDIGDDDHEDIGDDDHEDIGDDDHEDIGDDDHEDIGDVDDGGVGSDRDETTGVDRKGVRDEEADLDTTNSAKPPIGRSDSIRDTEVADRPGDGSSGSGVDGDESLLYRFRHNNDGALMWIREMLSSVAIVLVLGLILFAVSGVWPPMVAVESGSMEPNMEVGDLVFVTEPGRFAPDAAGNDVGIVTHEAGAAAEYRTFGSYGSVVIFQPPGRTASPIIHRAMFHVEEGENWYDRADGQYHSAADCGELRHCPAPHDGFITLGDNNGEYDQANGISAPVKADWVTGVARLRVPYLGYVRLIATGQAEFGDVLAMSVETNEYSMSGVGDPGRASDGGSADAFVSSGVRVGGVSG